MKLAALDQVSVSAVKADSLRPGEDFIVSDAYGQELLDKHPDKFRKIDDSQPGARAELAPITKAEAPPKNKAIVPPKNKAPIKPDYAEMTVPELKELAAKRNVDLDDAHKKADIVAALELSDEANASKAD